MKTKKENFKNNNFKNEVIKKSAFVSIRGGIKGLKDTNALDCVNSGDCTKGTNEEHCSNTGTCFN